MPSASLKLRFNNHKTNDVESGSSKELFVQVNAHILNLIKLIL